MDLRPACGHAGLMQAESSVPKETTEGKRRRWSILERRQIVEETLAPEASVARVARAHGVNANQVFSWRRLYKRGLLGAAAGTTLLPVRIADRLLAGGTAAAANNGAAAGTTSSGCLHVAVGKAQIHIEGDVDRDVLRMVLEHVLR
jgi:transposase